jgi:hypothetical protein
MLLKEYDVVRIVRLLHPAEHYDGWKLNRRAPKIGDIGTMVDIQQVATLPTNYIVEASSLDGVPDWLGDFAAEELKLVAYG